MQETSTTIGSSSSSSSSSGGINGAGLDSSLTGDVTGVGADVGNASNLEAGGSDATATESGSAMPCVTSGTELCDSFESGQLDSMVWKTLLMGPAASITVDSMHAHSGKYAVHAKVTPGQQSTAQITEAVTFPAMDDAFYTRIWAYISPDVMWPNNPPDFHTGFIIASGNNDRGRVLAAVGANLSPTSAAGPMHYLGYSIYPGDEYGPRSPTAVVNGAWTCIELFESGKGGTTAIRQIWADGVELPEQKDMFSAQKPPAFNLVAIGIWEYHPTPSLSDMWIDDVRISSQRVGCGN